MIETTELDEQAESVCRWGAARAAAIVVIPLIGLLWLTGNIVYMIARIGRIYGQELKTASIDGFISGMIGNAILVFLASSIPGLNIAIAAAVTYGVGKAAQAWIKDGTPSDIAKYKEEYGTARKQAERLQGEFVSDRRRRMPLGRKA